MVTPTTAAPMVAIHTGRIIAVGLLEPSEVRMAMTVVGMIWIEAVLIIMNIAMELVKVSFCGFFFCRVFIAFNPNGVAAFPKPSMFATMFMDISP